MVNDGVVNHWANLNFSRFVQENVESTFCMSWFTCAKHLEWYCAEFFIFSFYIGFAMLFLSSNILKLACCCTLQAFQGEPIVLVQSVHLEHAKRVISHLCEDAKKRTKVQIFLWPYHNIYFPQVGNIVYTFFFVCILFYVSYKNFNNQLCELIVYK